MKTVLVAATLVAAIASPALAWDNGWADQQNFLAQQQFNNQMLLQQQQMQQDMQQRQQMQFNWAARCMARGYQNCY